MGKLLLVLDNFFKIMFPDRVMPKKIDALISAFAGTNAMVNFSRAQTLSGAKTVIALMQAHGTQVDFNAAFSGFPVDSDDNEVDVEAPD